MTLPHMNAPPIVEVVCGVVFEPLALDPVLIGTYWLERKDQFPGHQLQPALTDAGVIFFAGQSRVWLLSKDEDFLLQLQSDRFYLNWRLRGGDYPRFNDHPELGDQMSEGLLTKALKEFGAFANFCARAVGRRPSPIRIELAKVDQFTQPTHWKDFDDLADLLPWLRTFAAFRKSEYATVGVQFAEPRPGGDVQVILASHKETRGAAPPIPMVRMETRLTTLITDPTADLRPVFLAANDELNEVFENLVPDGQYGRFRKGGTQ